MINERNKKGFKMVGRILFGAPFVGFGILHLTKTAGLTGLVPSYLPAPSLWVSSSGSSSSSPGLR